MIPPLDPQCQLQAIKAALDLFGKPGQLREICAISTGAVSEFGTDTQHLAEWALRQDLGKAGHGVYFIMNQFDQPDKGRTKDENVTLRIWVLLDIDTTKADLKASASDAEKAAGRMVADQVWAGLGLARRNGREPVFRSMVFVDSGNGAQICIPISLPNNADTTAAIKGLCVRLEKTYGSAAAHVDLKCGNAARLAKLPGTHARKGAHTQERPHRLAAIIHRPETITDDDRANNSQSLLEILKQERSKAQPAAISEMTPAEERSYADSVARDAEERTATAEDIDDIGDIHQRSRRAEAHINAMPVSVSGNGGSQKLYAVAMVAVEGFGLPEYAALASMESWNQRCKPAWSERELRHTITNALKDAGKTNKIGYLSLQEKPAPASITAPAPLLPVADGWPQPIAEAAFIGPIGAFVRRATANSEADRSACLVAALIRFGSRIGRTAVLKVGGTQHHANEFGLLVGPTGSGRKGTTLSYAAILFGQTDSLKPDWNDPLIGRDSTGLSSGQGVIHALRDPAGDDAGVLEKRLLVSESEFAKVLAGCRANESTLSAVIRDFWDSGNAAIMNKNSPTAATNAHLSILAAITPDELTTTATAADVQNGFLNRFLIICCRRPGLAPLPPEVNPSQFIQERGQLRRALESRINLADPAIHFDQEAQGFWPAAYAKLDSIRHGAAESLLARAAGHVLRLAIIYAVSEDSASITKRHLQAALMVWDYAENSVRYLFGDSTGDKKADWILDEIRATPEGLTRQDIYTLTSRNLSSTDLNKIRSRLLQAGLIRVAIEPATKGRPTERWFSPESTK